MEFGGILRSTTYCRGFQVDEWGKCSDVASEAGEVSLNLGFSKFGVKFGGRFAFNASKLQGETSGKFSEKDLKKITMSLRKVGVPPVIHNKEEWGRGLASNSSTWRIISRTTAPKPIWELLEKHKDAFEDYNSCKASMEHDWRNSKYDTLLALRNWLESTYMTEDIESSLKDFSEIRKKCYENAEEDWRKDVLYNERVQEHLIWALQCTKKRRGCL